MASAHQEILVHRLAVREGFGGFFQGIPADDEIGDQEEQQVLPGGPVRFLFYDDGSDEQQGCGDDLDDPFLYAPFFMFVVVLVVLMVFMMLMMLVMLMKIMMMLVMMIV